MKSYKLRNLPDGIYMLLKAKQAQLKNEKGVFYSLERVIYLMLLNGKNK